MFFEEIEDSFTTSEPTGWTIVDPVGWTRDDAGTWDG
jgi:hypothetical protein